LGENPSAVPINRFKAEYMNKYKLEVTEDESFEYCSDEHIKKEITKVQRNQIILMNKLEELEYKIENIFKFIFSRRG
jgi:hypothetical protein